MLVPDIKSVNKKDVKNTILFLDDAEEYGTSYNTEIFIDEKKKDKFIKEIEGIVRNSFEYRNYVNILKNELNYKSCTFLPNLNLDNAKFSLEFHHYPFTLYDLVAIEVNYLIKKEEVAINPFDVAEKIVKYHYQNLVGLVPLSVTLHQLVHDGQKFINKKYIIGDYKYYIEKFNDKIDNEFLDKVNEIEKLSEMEDNGADIDNNILDINILKIVHENSLEGNPLPLKPLKVNKKKVI